MAGLTQTINNNRVGTGIAGRLLLLKWNSDFADQKRENLFTWISPTGGFDLLVLTFTLTNEERRTVFKHPIQHLRSKPLLDKSPAHRGAFS